MTEFEGWIPDARAGGCPETGSLSYRNHNPGNLRDSPFKLGLRFGYAYFIDDETGRFALIWDLWAKCTGRTNGRLTGESTLADLIAVYSGEAPQKVEQYVKYVEERTGFSRSLKLKEIVK